MGVSQVAADCSTQATKTKTIGRFSVEATVQKPKERQFQVVPVPCVFTRGRWKCWDFKIGTDISHFSPDILEFAEKAPSNTEKTQPTQPTPANVESTSITVKNTNPTVDHTHQTVFTHTVTTCDVAGSVDHKVREHTFKESSTIVVTSIEPAPLTPVHSAKESKGADLECTDGRSRVVVGNASPTKHKPTCTFHNADVRDLSSSDSADSYDSYGRASAGTNMDNTSPPPHNVSPPPVQVNNNYGASLSRQTSVNGFANPDPSSIVSPTHELPVDDSSTVPQNTVAIDNKIEQAMDLVKTHLTYAVREEVDILRSHIVELEGRVNDLERQNQYLRQFVPPEILANLPMLISQQRMLPTANQQIPITQIPGLTMHQPQTVQNMTSVPNRNGSAINPQITSSTGGSPKGNIEQPPPSMIPKLNRPSGIPLPNSFFESSGVRRSPEP